MKHLLNLLAAVALLIWGTHLVRTGILRVFGANLRQLISRSVSTRLTAVLSGIGVTALVQSSTATALIVSSFVGQGLVGLPAALAVTLPELLGLLRGRMPPPDATQTQLRTGSWWSGPDIYVVVDDYDLVSTAGGNVLAPIVEFLPYAGDLGLHLVVARRGAGADRAMFEPLLAGLRDLGCMSLTMDGSSDVGAPLRPARPVHMPPGRGVLTTGSGDDDLVQVAWTPP